MPINKILGGLNLLVEADDDAVVWLESVHRLQDWVEGNGTVCLEFHGFAFYPNLALRTRKR